MMLSSSPSWWHNHEHPGSNFRRVPSKRKPSAGWQELSPGDVAVHADRSSSDENELVPCNTRGGTFVTSTSKRSALSSSSKRLLTANSSRNLGAMASSNQPIAGQRSNNTENLLTNSPATLHEVFLRVISQRVEINDQLQDLCLLVSSFHGFRPPAVSTEDYLRRLLAYSGCSPACFVTALCYVDQLAASKRELVLTSLNVHRVILTAVMLAAKFLEDDAKSTAHFASIGGISAAELCALERGMLKAMNYQLIVTSEQYECCERALLAECIGYLQDDLALERVSSEASGDSTVSRQSSSVASIDYDAWLDCNLSRASTAASSKSSVRARAHDPLRAALREAGFYPNDTKRSLSLAENVQLSPIV
mmetsp:Transcript_10770/g.28807  ORF Transcript_10770/g.28807 Transcript_10770/m.28807 type:complete len:364 (-) Transcript_10770:638-1729(-)